MKKLSTVEIPLYSVEEGLCLWIDARCKDTLYDTAGDPEVHYEARFQLVEGCFYDYKLSSDKYILKDPYDNIVQPHKRIPNSGTIAPNIYVGTLEIGIHEKESNKYKGVVQLEVQSAKTGYRNDYHDMLALITEKCTDLLLLANSPVTHHFEVDYTKDSQTLYQRFAFIQSVLGTDEFAEAVHRIVSMPVTRWTETTEERDVRSAGRYSNTNIKQILKGGNRTKLPDYHSLHQYGVVSLPERISIERKIDSVDTPENRFIKHALESFLKLCTDINKAAEKCNHPKLLHESEALIHKLENHLHHSVFKNISRPSLLKLNSPVLQRKEGYREVLRVWLMFDLAAKLIWKGGDDVYSGGKKDVAVLYEYWLFFVLLDLLQDIFHIAAKDLSELIQESSDGLNLQIKQGKFIVLSGIYDKGPRKLNIRFSYNRSFTGKQEYPKGGSWTVTLRPDYTLSFWPYGIEEEEAERQELIVHVHFDAKYKVDNLLSYQAHLNDEELNNEKTENRKGIYKNADLLKMHAYKDAIRRTSGAYILYPGDKPYNEKGFHEIIPGLGAFPVNPRNKERHVDELKTFIQEIVEHLVNLCTQREKIALQNYDIHKKPAAAPPVKEPYPEIYNENRDMIPDETFILVGFCKSEEHYDWIKNNMLYTLGLVYKGDPIGITRERINSRFVLLYSLEEDESLKLLKIKRDYTEFFSRQDLLNLNYPTPTHDSYLVFHLQEVTEPELKDIKLDITKLKVDKGKDPLVISLAELMKYKVL
jgi:predicted component of viral defense system (DUF524 family)